AHAGLAVVAAEHAERPLDGVRRQLGALALQFEQLPEEPADQLGFGRRPRDGDLVTADVNIRGKLPFNDMQQFVPGSEQANHGWAVRNNDSDRGPWTVTACIGQFTALEGPGAAPRAMCEGRTFPSCPACQGVTDSRLQDMRVRAPSRTGAGQSWSRTPR